MKEQLLRELPSVGSLLETPAVAGWLAEYPRILVTACLRDAVAELRRRILTDEAGRCGPGHVSASAVMALAGELLSGRTQPHIRPAINATGIILHTGLGRAVLPACVAESMLPAMAGYVTLAVDRDTGERSDRDLAVEYVLTELTGAQAATVVNNNAAATVLALAALAAGREVVISRGQLIEIGGSFRLPDVMAQSGARMVEVGTTNRTHLRDYEAALSDQTALLLRVHPSNYRVVGFVSEVSLEEMVSLARTRGALVLDDLGAGALIGLERFGLPHEPTMGESIAAGADVVIASGDKLIGASQAGVIVGRSEPIERIRSHPLARAFRPDKACLMALERTLMLFRDPDRLVLEHPTYRMLATSMDVLAARAGAMVEAIRRLAPAAEADTAEGVGYLGSGSLPMQALPTRLVRLTLPGVSAAELARRLRVDEECIFTRIENERVLMDARTVTDEQVLRIAQAVSRAQKEPVRP